MQGTVPLDLQVEISMAGALTMYGMACRETDSSSQETGTTDADEVRCTAHAHRSPPSKAEPAAAKTFEQARRASPSTPDICTQRPASKPTPMSNAPRKFSLD